MEVSHFIAQLVTSLASVQVAERERPFGLDLTIESMESQSFSIGIFIFLIIGIAVFTGFVLAYMRKGRGASLKTGEKYLFAWILFGIVVAIVFGAVQLLFGSLF